MFETSSLVGLFPGHLRDVPEGLNLFLAHTQQLLPINLQTIWSLIQDSEYSTQGYLIVFLQQTFTKHYEYIVLVVVVVVVVVVTIIIIIIITHGRNEKCLQDFGW